MGFVFKLSIFILIVAVGIGYNIYEALLPPQMEEITLKYWGPGKEKSDDYSINPFKINFPDSDLKYLNDKLARTTFSASPLENVGFEYGVTSTYLKKIVEFWKSKYNWQEREPYLNQFPQFTTEISGLKIHFLHVKPDPSKIKGKQVLPLLILHGWPGSVVEFYKIIPMLITPREDADFVFEVIAPSLPGYAFSQGTSKPGLDAAQMGLIFDALMTRLNFNTYFVQGGDWGSIIGKTLSILRPDRILGYHSNMCSAMTNKAVYYMFMSALFPKIFLEESEQEKYVAQFSNLLMESGYMHLQSTKPDTIGAVLTDSPVGLAAYILEKFSTWTNKEWKSLPDGGLDKLDKTELLDNIMIYWQTKSISTSVRLYKETFSKQFYKSAIEKQKVVVPSGCAVFEHEIFFQPKFIVEEGFSNLVQINYYSFGGHFAAFEQPKVLSNDVYNFIKKVRAKRLSK